MLCCFYEAKCLSILFGTCQRAMQLKLPGALTLDPIREVHITLNPPGESSNYLREVQKIPQILLGKLKAFILITVIMRLGLTYFRFSMKAVGVQEFPIFTGVCY